LSDQAPVKPPGRRPNRTVVALLVAVCLVITIPVAGYYVESYYSASRVTVDIISGSRTLGNPINYTLLIRISVPGAILPVKLWPPTVSLSLDSYYLGGEFPCQPSPGDFWDHLNPGDSLTCQGYWQSSFADHPGQPPVEGALNKTNTNNLVLGVFFPQVIAGWSNQTMLKTISTVWTWT
jgi:hypothetical protein